MVALYATSCQVKVAAQPALPLQPLPAQTTTALVPAPSVVVPAQPCVLTFAKKYAAKPLVKAACAAVPQATPATPPVPPDVLPLLPLVPPAEVPALSPLVPPAEVPALPLAPLPLAPAVAAPPLPALPLASPAAPPSSVPAALVPESAPAVALPLPPFELPALALAPPLPAWPEEPALDEPALDEPESSLELEQAAKQPATETTSNKLIPRRRRAFRISERRVMVSGVRCVARCEGPMVPSAELNPRNQK